jgi:hypothetical protein
MKQAFTVALLALLVVPFALPCSSAAATAPPASGASGLYGVEIIVFRASSPGAEEAWDANLPGRGFGNTANRGGAVPTITRILSASDYHLSGLESALKSSGAWRPLAHAAWIQTAANWGTHTGFSLSEVGINVPGLSGTVYLERATYIHLGFDVQYQAAGNYAIKDMRSVKYNDKQYFDHPGFGILAVVTPVKRGDAATAQ